ncbi:hypothetical protein TNCV_1126081 [Trichonephila clavipes]|nr:hypothetical protein TNCV_1126081 [Trichonephila clavipes]
MPSPAFEARAQQCTTLHKEVCWGHQKGRVSSDERRRKKCHHLMKGVAEDHQALLTAKKSTTQQVLSNDCSYIEYEAAKGLVDEI